MDLSGWSTTTSFYLRAIFPRMLRNLTENLVMKFITSLNYELTQWKKEAINIGDFNAHARIWGSNTNDARGKYIRDWIATRGLILLNYGGTPTFTRGLTESFLDLTICTRAIADKVKKWAVLSNRECLSDHNYIYCEIKCRRSSPHFIRRATYRRPKEHHLFTMRKCLQDSTTNVEDTAVAKKLCNDILGKPRNRNRKMPVHWWSEVINSKRKLCVSAKRTLARETRLQKKSGAPARSTKRRDATLKTKLRTLRSAATRKFCRNSTITPGA